MTKLASMLAAAALAAVPLAAQAQDHHDDYRATGHDRSARSATSHGYDASARTFNRHDQRAAWGGDNRGRFYGYSDRYRQGDGRRFDRYDGGRFRGGVTLGFGYGGYYPYYRPYGAVYVAPAPVVVQPAPVYAQPAPVYQQPGPPAAYAQPAQGPTYYPPAPSQAYSPSAAPPSYSQPSNQPPAPLQ